MARKSLHQGDLSCNAVKAEEVRHWSRAETAGDQLVRNDKSNPEQSVMARGGRGGGGSLMAYDPLGAMGVSR